MRLTIGNIYNFKIILKLIWHEDGSYNFQKKKNQLIIVIFHTMLNNYK